MSESAFWVFVAFIFALTYILQSPDIPKPRQEARKAVTRYKEVVQWKIERVTDGDTVRANGKAIRLGFIDAPEMKQKGGVESKANLEKVCKPGMVAKVTILNRDSRYDRLNGLVQIGDTDLSTYQVKSGHAWVYPSFNKNPELPLIEQKARKARVGLWKDKKPVPPWDYRKNKKGK